MSTASSTRSLPRPFWRFLAGSGVSNLGSAVTAVALPLTAVSVLHASTLSVGAIVAAGDVGWLLFGLPAGVLVARLPLRATQVTMDLVRALAIGSIPVSYWLGALSIPQLIGAALVVGVASVIFAVGNSTIVVALVDDADLLAANSALSAVRSTTLLTGPGLGGFLVELIGAASCLVTDAVSYVISALLLWSLPRPARLPGGAADGRLRDLILEGLRFAAEHPVLRRMLVLNTVVNLLGGGLLALTPVLLVRDLHEPAFVLGLVYACEGVGGLVGATLAPRAARRFGTARMVLAVTWSAPLGALLIAFGFGGWGAVFPGLGFALFAGGLIIAGTILSTYRQREAPAELLPRLLATHRMISWGSAPVGALAASGVAAVLGIHVALLALAGVGVLAPASVWSSALLRGARDLPSPRDLPNRRDLPSPRDLPSGSATT